MRLINLHTQLARRSLARQIARRYAHVPPPPLSNFRPVEAAYPAADTPLVWHQDVAPQPLAAAQPPQPELSPQPSLGQIRRALGTEPAEAQPQPPAVEPTSPESRPQPSLDEIRRALASQRAAAQPAQLPASGRVQTRRDMPVRSSLDERGPNSAMPWAIGHVPAAPKNAPLVSDSPLAADEVPSAVTGSETSGLAAREMAQRPATNIPDTSATTPPEAAQRSAITISAPPGAKIPEANRSLDAVEPSSLAGTSTVDVASTATSGAQVVQRQLAPDPRAPTANQPRPADMAPSETPGRSPGSGALPDAATRPALLPSAPDAGQAVMGGPLAPPPRLPAENFATILPEAAPSLPPAGQAAPSAARDVGAVIRVDNTLVQRQLDATPSKSDQPLGKPPIPAPEAVAHLTPSVQGADESSLAPVIHLDSGTEVSPDGASAAAPAGEQLAPMTSMPAALTHIASAITGQPAPAAPGVDARIANITTEAAASRPEARPAPEPSLSEASPAAPETAQIHEPQRSASLPALVQRAPASAAPRLPAGEVETPIRTDLGQRQATPAGGTRLITTQPAEPSAQDQSVSISAGSHPDTAGASFARADAGGSPPAPSREVEARPVDAQPGPRPPASLSRPMADQAEPAQESLALIIERWRQPPTDAVQPQSNLPESASILGAPPDEPDGKQSPIRIAPAASPAAGGPGLIQRSEAAPPAAEAGPEAALPPAQSASAPPAQPEPPAADVEAMAREVYRLLRRRLGVEQERTRGWNG